MFHTILFPILYGLSIFLIGMKVMEIALARWAGPVLVSLLSKATSSPIKGMLFSTLITAVLQSSTAVTVITIGLVNAGLLTYARTLGIILGTNIGTCLTTELMGLQLGQIAIPLLLLSIVTWGAAVILHDYTPRKLRYFKHVFEPLQYISLVIAGFALIMFGIHVMQSIGPTLDSYGVFAWFIERASQNVLWGIIAGACLTALIHSSAAVIGLAMGLASSGALPVEIGIAIVLGSNVGTCVTAVIAAASSSPSGKFVAWTHVILNVGGAALFMPFIQQLHDVSSWISSDLGRQIAHSQTIFNILCSLIALPICYLPIWKRIHHSSS
ncbi:Na/Pi cotransporter family protein [Paenibacillus crassostreae]|uniref:Sodium:phosphate symporter n=1 Tax=Paenibacillus crassostreae TaxID=1763538 RepID=A0A167C2A5_9BACL|nr:Na/Pi symporter [Paenibacillus crassostreae]AOZ91736.1 sodium:phosphate symporter [Paenibacillus crassostreae]OAB72691.1 sodium:phosphate symporter [Paenibacillus crassostreae]